MTKIWNQLTGREPEPVWMSALGAVCAMFVLPALMMIACVAMGVK